MCVSFSKGDKGIRSRKEATEKKLKRQLHHQPARTKSTIQSNTLSFLFEETNAQGVGRLGQKEMKGQSAAVERRRKAPQRMITTTSGTQESDLLIFK